MVLTPAGERLYAFIRPFFEQLPGVVRSLKRGDFEGELVIRSASLFLRHLLPSWIKRLYKRHPGVRVSLGETEQPDLAALRQGNADLVVDYVPEVPSDLAALHVATLRPFIVAPKNHAASRRKRLNLAQLAQETFVSYPDGSPAQALQLQALAKHGIAPTQTIAASSADVILGFVESGLGYSLVPSLDADGPRAKGVRVEALASPKVEFRVSALWRKDTPENPLLDAALETAPQP